MSRRDFRLSNRLRVLRAETRITQEELAEAVGVSRQTIIAIEKGDYAPSVLLALALARHFGKPVEEVFQAEPSESRD
ncbi:MAG: helix-turn-helix transcriptional regulator [Elusimicrobiota bacterium]